MSDKMRHVSELKNLPIHQMNDEEMVKAMMHRFEGRMTILVYSDKTGYVQMLYRYKNARGKWLCDTLIYL